MALSALARLGDEANEEDWARLRAGCAARSCASALLCIERSWFANHTNDVGG